MCPSASISLFLPSASLGPKHTHTWGSQAGSERIGTRSVVVLSEKESERLPALLIDLIFISSRASFDVETRHVSASRALMTLLSWLFYAHYHEHHPADNSLGWIAVHGAQLSS